MSLVVKTFNGRELLQELIFRRVSLKRFIYLRKGDRFWGPRRSRQYQRDFVQYTNKQIEYVFLYSIIFPDILRWIYTIYKESILLLQKFQKHIFLNQLLRSIQLMLFLFISKYSHHILAVQKPMLFLLNSIVVYKTKSQYQGSGFYLLQRLLAFQKWLFFDKINRYKPFREDRESLNIS